MATGVAVVPGPAADPGPALSGWEWLGECRDESPEAMFPPDGRNTKAREAAEARARKICEDCPVRRQCLATALFRGDEHGVWGGLTSDERRELPWPGGTPDDALAFAARVLGGGGA